MMAAFATKTRSCVRANRTLQIVSFGLYERAFLSTVSSVPNVINLAIGKPSADLMPLDDLRFYTDQFYSQRENHVKLNYGKADGTNLFKNSLVSFLGKHNDFHETEHVAFTGGNSATLNMLCQLFSSPGRLVFCEEPTYFLAKQIFIDNGLLVKGISCDANGLVVEELEKGLLDLRRKGISTRGAILYIIPFFHNPTGTCLSSSRQKAILELAHEHEMLILSDEPYNMLSFRGVAKPSLSSLGRENVISLGSFSKIVSPGLRCGWISSSPTNIAKFLNHGVLQSGGSLNPVSAEILAYYMSSDMENNLVMHIQKVCTELRDRCSQLIKSIEKYLKPLGVSVFEPKGGYFLWMTLPEGLRAQQFRATCLNHGVDFIPGERCSALVGNNKNSRNLRLSFSFYSSEILEEGIRRISIALKEHMSTL